VESKPKEYVYKWDEGPFWPNAPRAVSLTPEPERSAARTALVQGAVAEVSANIYQIERHPFNRHYDTLVLTPLPRQSWRARLGRWLEQIGLELQKQ
jgi:hypothetical protein